MVKQTVAKIVLLGTVLTGCELTEVTVPSGEPVVVVHSVLSVGQTTQFVILERSLTGGPSSLVYAGLVPPAPAGAGTPIEGATVTLTHTDPRGCATPTVQLVERPIVDLGFGPLPSGTYVTSSLCPLEPGDRIDLRVETTEGDVVLGTTIVPGVRSIVVRVGAGMANTTLRRRTDSLHVDVDPIAARALALDVGRDRARTPNLFDDVLSLAMDTMGVSLAGDLITFDDSDDGEAVFKPGRYYTLSVAVTDTNYFDFVRSFSNPLTGRGFINHLDGGVGVFGSVLTNDYDVRVVDDQLDPREGEYRITGVFNGTPVDVVLDVYLAPLGASEIGIFSAFVDGTWVGGPVATSADGAYSFHDRVAGSLTGAFFAGFVVAGADTVTYRMTGPVSRPDRPFDVEVRAVVGSEMVAVDTLSAVLTTPVSSSR